jgi:hypothetical protein
VCFLLAPCVQLAAAAPPTQGALAPLNPAAPTPAPAYESAFAGYKPDVDASSADWKQTNAAIAGASGHAGHGKLTPEAPAPAKEKAAAPDPHANHKQHH